MLRSLLVLALAGALGVSAQAAPQRYPATTTIGDVPAQVDGDASLAGVQILIPGGLDRQTSRQNGYAALLAEIVAQTPVDGGDGKLPLRDAIAALGANLGVDVQPQDVEYYVEGTPKAVTDALALLGNALANPDFSHDTLAKAKTSLRARIEEANQSPFGVVSTMLRSAYYENSGAGYSPMGSEAVVFNAGADALQRFWVENYRKGGAVVAAAGRIDETVARAARAAVANLPEGTPSPLPLRTRTLSDTPARIITHRDVGLPWVGIGFPAPAVGSKDFATMLVVQAIISSLGRTDAIVTRPAALRPINAVYQYDVTPANLIVYASGSGGPTQMGLREIFGATELLAEKPLDAAVVSRYRTLAMGQFLIDNMTLEERSAFVGLTARLGLDANYANAVLNDISAVGPADVQRVAKAYLGKYTVGLILPRPTQKER